MPEVNLDEAFGAAKAFLSGSLDVAQIYDPLGPDEKAEVRVLADRLIRFVGQRTGTSGPIFKPRFSGQGAIEPCEGDVQAGDSLIEVKSVDRGYRSIDLRQSLIYAALDYLAGNSRYSELVIYNSLAGTSITTTPDQLVLAAGGKTKEEFFHEFSFAVGSGEISR